MANKNKTVLVMGGSYFIGKKIVDSLLLKKYEVTVLNRGTKPVPIGAKSIICDRNDSLKMRILLRKEKFDYVIDVSCLNKVQAIILHNSLDLRWLKKYIFISSSSVYEINDTISKPDRFKESCPRGKNIYWGDYGINKINVEKYLEKAYKDCQTQIIILRPPYVYGENNYVNRESFFFDHILNDKKIILPNGGETKIQLIYSGDLANTILSMLELHLMKYQIYNIGNEIAVSFNLMVEVCGIIAQKKPQIIHFDYKKNNYNPIDFFPFNDYENILDVTEIKKFYTNQTKLFDGLKRAFEWYNENKSNITFKESRSETEKKILNNISWWR